MNLSPFPFLQAIRTLLWTGLFLLMGNASNAQSGNSLTGTVVNQNGELMSGVTVEARNQKNNSPLTSLTNEKGVFSFPNLNAGTTYTLDFSYVGYEKNTVRAFSIKPGENSLLVHLAPSANPLDQVVVIGYGAQKRETVTGSIATVRADDFNKGVISDPLTLITGKVAGLSITRPNGSDPNAIADFQIRGAATVEGNSLPLVVIDGVPMPDGVGITNVAPADIASIDILRDGSSAAIYGSRANAGVIIVTTKRGAIGATRVSYTGYAATELIAKSYKVLSGDQYRQYGTANGIDANDQGANTNWLKAMTRTPFNHGHNLNVSGGGGKTTFNAALNYQKYQGNDLVGNREFINGNLQINSKAFNDKLDIGLILANSYDNRNYADYYGFGQALVENPTYPIYDSTGGYFETPNVNNGAFWNPVANSKYGTNNAKEKKFLGTVRLSYPLLPSLRATVSYSINRIDTLTGSYTNSNLIYEQTSGLNGTASRSEGAQTDNIFEANLNYNKLIKDHSFNVIAGYSYFNAFNEQFGAGNNNFSTNAYLYNNLGSGTALNDLSGNGNRGNVYVYSDAAEWTLLSYYARLIYSYKDKYLLNASIRREGSSKLGAGNKWGNFPGVSAGWILSKEDFLSGTSFLPFLKLRAGYGITGNQGSLFPYQSLASIGPWPYGNMYSFFGNPANSYYVQAYGPSINANPNLKWEIKKELNIGLDFSLFKNSRLTGSIDVYNRRIEDLIGNYNAQTPSQIWPLVFANAGVMTNKGIELSVNGKIVDHKKFRWNANFVSSYNKNEVVSVTSPQFSGSAHDISQINGYGTETQRIAAGHSVSEFYGKVFDGFTADGQWLFKNSKGEAVTSDQISGTDYRFLGNSIPKVNLALTNNFVAGNFDFSFMLRAALGFKVLNAKRVYHENINDFASMNLFVSALHSPVKGEPTFSSYYLENGDYLKLDNVNIGYNLPISKNAYVQRIRVAVAATNLLTLTSFSGIDPELGLSPYNYTGVEQNDHYYPRTRSLTFTVTADF